MKHNGTIPRLVGLGLLILVLVGTGCESSPTMTQPATASQPAAPDALELASQPGGARIWAQTCMRCHNLRPPRERSDREWEAITLHMRIRAGLTADEHRRILGFLKAAN